MEPNPYQSPTVAQPLESVPICDGKHCPAWDQDTGIWPIVTAMSPHRIRCPHCRTRLAFRGTTMRLMAVMVLITMTFCVVAYIFIRRLGFESPWDAVVFAAIAGPLLVALEVVVSIHLRRRHVLIKAD